MRAVKIFQSILILAVCSFVFSTAILAQDENPEKTPEKIARNTSTTVSTDDKDKDDDVETTEAKKAVNAYTNYLEDYKLGPNDVISVSVFGQCPDYCNGGIVIPPTARINYPLIREGVFVGGKTTFQIQDELTKKLDEYIIDPKVTVTLEKAGSALYSVMGKVAAPGPRIMDRRLTINDALISAGGLVKGASKKKVYIARFNSQGFYERQAVDLEGIERGKVATVYLKPGDQIVVGSKGFTWDKFFDYLGKAGAARILFGSPF